MILGLLTFAVMFAMPIVLSVVALTGETSPRGLLLAMLQATNTAYTTDPNARSASRS